MREIFQTVPVGFQWPDKAVISTLIDIFNHAEGGRCVLVMDELRSVDCYGLEMLVLMSDMAQARGMTMVLRQPQDQVKKKLVQTELSKMISIET
jgi:anti-anti-sigma factor